MLSGDMASMPGLLNRNVIKSFPFIASAQYVDSSNQIHPLPGITFTVQLQAEDDVHSVTVGASAVDPGSASIYPLGSVTPITSMGGVYLRSGGYYYGNLGVDISKMSLPSGAPNLYVAGGIIWFPIAIETYAGGQSVKMSEGVTWGFQFLSTGSYGLINTDGTPALNAPGPGTAYLADHPIPIRFRLNAKPKPFFQLPVP
jgi:hypothetical protein